MKTTPRLIPFHSSKYYFWINNKVSISERDFRQDVSTVRKQLLSSTLKSQHVIAIAMTPRLLQLSLGFDDFSKHKVFVTTNFVAGNDHDEISHIGHFVFIVGHEFARKPESLAILWDNPVSVHSNIDCLVHFIGNDFSHQGTSRILAGLRVHKVPSWNSRHVCQLFIGQRRDFICIN